jgi:hypothetical protein
MRERARQCERPRQYGREQGSVKESKAMRDRESKAVRESKGVRESNVREAVREAVLRQYCDGGTAVLGQCYDSHT